MANGRRNIITEETLVGRINDFLRGSHQKICSLPLIEEKGYGLYSIGYYKLDLSRQPIKVIDYNIDIHMEGRRLGMLYHFEELASKEGRDD